VASREMNAKESMDGNHAERGEAEQKNEWERREMSG
jgi:hypothetical protein